MIDSEEKQGFGGKELDFLEMDEYADLCAALNEARQTMIWEIESSAMFFHPTANTFGTSGRVRQALAWLVEYTIGFPQKVLFAFKDYTSYILSNAKWWNYWMLLPILFMSWLKVTTVALRAFRTCVVNRQNVMCRKRTLLENLKDGFF